MIPEESKVNIKVEGEEDENQKGKTKNRDKNRLIKKQIMGTHKFMQIDPEIAELECRFCQGYLIYLH